MEDIKLIPAEEKYWDSYIEFLYDEGELTEQEISKIDKLKEEGWQSFINKATDFTRLITYPDGSKAKPVPQDALWLIKNNDVIGRYNLRHHLLPHLEKEGGHIGALIKTSERKKGYGSLGLSLTLSFAKALDLNKVLVTCDDDNVGSQKIIENNGGIYQDKGEVDGNDKLVRRYWIKL